MMTQRKSLQLHPMFIDGPITSFTAFHNVNCPHGFLYFSAEVRGLVGVEGYSTEVKVQRVLMRV